MQELWTILTNVTGAHPWVWKVALVSYHTSRALRAYFPQTPVEPIVLRDAEIARLRAMLEGSGLNPGVSPTFPGNSVRPQWAAALISIVSPVTLTVDALLWALTYLVKAALKRITGQDVPDGSGVLDLRNGGGGGR